ncbi:hypothetical protein CVT24_008318 [Panaeolus cyanescens]|uniref:N-acetyltransferase domain-containing protein n=1 Tax=Panaeolus cyanescens TaxID=181874 RepID=A0A409YLK3_9AGAR|nr:hypothetical protein CVT24_008318 [Panaeolus cyanescens]
MSAFESLGITTRSLASSDLPYIRGFLADIFTRKEPVMSFLKITIDAYNTFNDEFSHHFDLDLSTVACLPSGEIIATFLACPFDASFDVTKIDETVIGSLGLAVGLMEEFTKEVLEKLNVELGRNAKALNLVSGATADAYENMGINKRLRAETLEKAKKSGKWDIAVVECSNGVTQHLMRDVYGFEVFKEVKYADYEEQDGEGGFKKPFLGLEGSTMILFKNLK